MRFLLRCCLFLSLSAGACVPASGKEIPDEALKVLQHRVGRWEVRNEVLGPDGQVIRVTSERQEAGFVINDQIVEIHGFIEGP